MKLHWHQKSTEYGNSVPFSGWKWGWNKIQITVVQGETSEVLLKQRGGEGVFRKGYVGIHNTIYEPSKIISLKITLLSIY